MGQKLLQTAVDNCIIDLPGLIIAIHQFAHGGHAGGNLDCNMADGSIAGFINSSNDYGVVAKGKGFGIYVTFISNYLSIKGGGKLFNTG